MTPLSKYDRSFVVQYITALVAKPSHFNSLKSSYNFGAPASYVQAIAEACGVQRGLKDSRLELPDLKPVAEKLLESTDPGTRELAGEMLRQVKNELLYYTPPAAPAPKAAQPARTPIHDQPRGAVALAEPPTKQSYSPYAAHAGTGKCPTCRQPLPGSGR